MEDFHGTDVVDVNFGFHYDDETECEFWIMMIGYRFLFILMARMGVTKLRSQMVAFDLVLRIINLRGEREGSSPLS